MEYILVCIFWAVIIVLLYGAGLYVMDRQLEFEVRKSKEVHKMIQDINKFADNKINETNGKKVKIMKIAIITVLVALCVYSASSNAACTYRTDSWGNTKYTCDGGNGGTLRTDSWGNTRDSGTGLTYRKDSWGNTRASDGTTYRTDSWGNTRGSDGTTARKDSWGNTIITDKSGSRTTCRTDSWGNTRCN